jgi:hypothetical protein
MTPDQKDNNTTYITKLPIVDQEAYLKYQELVKHPILNKMSKYTDTKGRTINIGMTPANLQKNIADLSTSEQHNIMVLKHRHLAIMGKRNGFLRKAFGTFVTADGSKLSEVNEKLNERKLDLIELFGKMFTTKEVHQIVLDQFNLRSVTLKQIEIFKARYSPEINIKIEEHKRTFSDIRLGHKRSRLEELSWMYMKRKRIYQLTNKPDDHRLLLQTIEQIRKEAEGDLLRIDGQLVHNIEGTIQAHIQNEVLKFLNLKEIILARVAAKANITPIKLIESMSRSYYHRILELSEPVQIEEFPSMQVYDFDRIKRIQEQKAVTEKIYSTTIDAVAIPAEKKEAVKDIKELLMAKLKQKTGDINYAKNSIEAMLVDKTNDIEI